MKRSKKLERKEGETKWKKIGGGSLRLGKRIIKPGQVFYAKDEDIPDIFTNVLENIDNTEKKPFVEPQKKLIDKTRKVHTTVYSLKLNEEVSTEEKPMYDIVGEADKVINEEPLSKEDAEATIEALK